MADELKKEHLIISDVQGEIASTGHYDLRITSLRATKT